MSKKRFTSSTTSLTDLASYFTCGLVDDEYATSASCLSVSMRRASVSRRKSGDVPPSPLQRSRSSERMTHSAPMAPPSHLAPPKLEVQASDVSERYHDDSQYFETPTHRRAMSDPFDTAEKEEKEGEFLEALADDLAAIGIAAYPTLPRYPVAETRNKNCWSEPDVSIFSVRGENYFQNNKKVPSGPYLLAARGIDLFLSDKSENVDMEHMTHSILGGQLRKKPTVAIQFRFPWGFLNLYFEVSAKLEKYLNQTVTKIENGMSRPEKTLAAWLLGDEDYKNERLKLIPYVAEGPWVVRNMVTGRPAIIGKKLPVTYQLAKRGSHEAPLLTAVLDIGSSSNAAKRIVSVCRRYMSALTVDVGFVIQGETAEELPEQMLGSIRIHSLDPLKAPHLSSVMKSAAN